MNFKTLSKEEIETMPFDDLAYAILKEKGKKMKINQIFKIICDEQIGDFFTLLATEKRFIQLDKGYWDLRENHKAEINIDDIEDDSEDEPVVEEAVPETDEENYYDDIDDADDDKGEDDLKDLVIVDEKYDEESDL